MGKGERSELEKWKKTHRHGTRLLALLKKIISHQGKDEAAWQTTPAQSTEEVAALDTDQKQYKKKWKKNLSQQGSVSNATVVR